MYTITIVAIGLFKNQVLRRHKYKKDVRGVILTIYVDAFSKTGHVYRDCTHMTPHDVSYTLLIVFRFMWFYLNERTRVFCTMFLVSKTTHSHSRFSFFCGRKRKRGEDAPPAERTSTRTTPH